MIDWARVRELQSEIGSENMQEVIMLFMEEVETSLSTLDDKNDAHDYEEAMHFLKGCALNIGFKDFAELCRIWEASAAGGDISVIDNERLRSIYGKSRQDFIEGMPSQLAA